METLIYKDYRNNWKAESEIMLNDKLQLRIATSKLFNCSLHTCATVGHVADGMVSHTVMQDFYKVIADNTYSRITAKVVEAQHKLANVDELVNQAKLFYNL